MTVGLRAKARAGERGFIIVAVLWILSAVAALVLVYSAYVSNTAMVIGDSTGRVEDQAVMTGAIELVCYQLLAINEKERPSSGRFSGRIAAARISAAHVSEAARLDLNMASKELLKGLMLGLGETRENADAYASRMIAWRSAVPTGKAADEDAENVYYRNSGLSYLPRHAAFPHVDELWLVHGIPEYLVARILPFVTVFNGRSTINIQDASPQVIAALPNMTPDRLQSILTARLSDKADPRELLSLAGVGDDVVTLERSNATRIAIEVEFGSGRRINSEVVVLLVDDGREPYRLLSRRDNVDAKAVSASPEKDVK